MDYKVTAPDLDRVVQNALLYADKKAIRLNEVFFYTNADGLGVYSCDDYIALGDSLSADLGNSEFALSIEDTEKLGEWIKKDKKVVHKYDIILRYKMTGIIFECDETSTEDSDNIFFSYRAPLQDTWNMVFQLLSEENEERTVSGFAVRPERLAKLARIKADKEAPIDMRGVDVNGHLIIQFRKGDTAVGAIMPVRRDRVKEEFLWPNIEA